tara:strand:- start:874 stop:1038 length:165 start_codon:yes stop_codon:yes gene_type:complete
MSKRFKVERNIGDLGILYVTLHQPPYEDENILERTGWKAKDVTITEMKQYQGEE